MSTRRFAESGPEILFHDDDDQQSLKSRLLRASSSEVMPLSAMAATSDASSIPFDPIRIDVQAITYTLGRGKRSKVILRNVNCSFVPGHLSAIMGPSGAGKTTLLNVLTDNAGGKLEGKIRVNGADRPRGFQTYFNLIPQSDILLAALTPSESLMYAAELRLPSSMSRKRKRALVEKVLRQLSIWECKDVMTGDHDRKGISGGQRKRTSIAIELLTSPSILFVDEPTSGLDSKTAEDVVEILKKIATEEGRTVVCTIHQPSYQIFERFDALTLLVQGEVAFTGLMSNVEPYFASQLKRVVPARQNPADFFMRELQGDLVDGVTSFADHWRGYCASPAGASALVLPMQTEVGELRSGARFETSCWKQAVVLLHRAIYDELKDKKKLMMVSFMRFFLGAMLGLVWLNSCRPLDNPQIFVVQGVLFTIVNNAVLGTLGNTVLTFPMRRALLLREYKNGTFSIVPWCVKCETSARAAPPPRVNERVASRRCPASPLNLPSLPLALPLCLPPTRCTFLLYPCRLSDCRYIAWMISTSLINFIHVLLMGLPVYFMVGLRLDGIQYFAVFFATLLVLAIIGSAAGMIIGALSKDVQSASAMILPTLVPLMLFSGYILPYNSLKVYFKPFYFVSFFQWALNLLEKNQFAGFTFPDCESREVVNPITGGASFTRNCFKADPLCIATCFATGDECVVWTAPRGLNTPSPLRARSGCALAQLLEPHTHPSPRLLRSFPSIGPTTYPPTDTSLR